MSVEVPKRIRQGRRTKEEKEKFFLGEKRVKDVNVRGLKDVEGVLGRGHSGDTTGVTTGQSRSVNDPELWRDV